MNDEEKYSLLDLHNKINEGNDGKQESLLRITYNPLNFEYEKFIADAELKPSRSDVSCCVTLEDGDSVCYELFFRNGCGTVNYEFYMDECFKNDYNRLKDEILKKHYFIFISLINPIYILHIISKNKYIIELIENNETTIGLIDAELKIEIYNEDLVL